MTSKLKCPFCGKKLWYDEQDGIYRCMKFGCVMDYEGGTEQLWQTLIQAKQDLEIAKADIEDYKKYKALWEQIRNNTILELERKLEIARKALKELWQATHYDTDGYLGKTIQHALEHTTHDNSEKANSQEHKE